MNDIGETGNSKKRYGDPSMTAVYMLVRGPISYVDEKHIHHKDAVQTLEWQVFHALSGLNNQASGNLLQVMSQLKNNGVTGAPESEVYDRLEKMKEAGWLARTG